MDPEIVWSPQPGPQTTLVDCPYKLIFYGGARGGGKSSGILGLFGICAHRYPGDNAVIFRQQLTQADDLIEEAKKIYIGLGAEYKSQPREFIFPNGSRIRFRALDKIEDAQKFQGQNLTRAAVDEVGNYSDPRVIWTLFGALRSARGIPVQLVLTGNPGGPGHWYLKKLFVDPAPLGMKELVFEIGSGKIKGIFIPAKVQDNPKLLEQDPGYIDRLHLVGSPELVRSWLYGDWNAIEGSYFSGVFTERNLHEPFPIPTHWPKILCFDWGYNSPYHAVWLAISTGQDDNRQESLYPKNCLIAYREHRGSLETNDVIAKNILDLSRDDKNLDIRVADPSIFASQGGPSIGEQMHRAGLLFKRADNERLAGWGQIRSRMIADPPMLTISTACKILIQEMQAAPVDKRKPEDLDTTAPDHSLDALRYGCMTRMWDPEPLKQPDPMLEGGVSIGQLYDEFKRKNKQIRI